MKRFKRHYEPDTEYDASMKDYARKLTGNLTPARNKLIENYVKGLNWINHCGCPHDCCGCQCEQMAKLIRQPNEVLIIVRKHYNY